MNRLALLLLLLIGHPALAQWSVQKFSWGDFGETHIYMGGSTGLELILTDSQHQQSAEQLAIQLSRQQKLATVLNMDTYLANLSARKAQCFDAATPLSVYAQDVEQQHGFAQFQPGFINGLGRAGSYVFALLKQVPAGLFRGAFSSELAAQINLPLPPCKTLADITWQPKTNMLLLSSAAAPATPWQGFNAWDKPWLDSVPLINNWQAARDNFESGLEAQTQTHSNRLGQLPLITLEANRAGQLVNQDTLALVISGDGGWANIDKDIANQLSAEGMPVVGWNALNYFWQKKDQQIAGEDLQAVVDFYRAQWHKTKLILIGFSLGADVLPFMVNQLNSQSRAQLLSVNLLNPSTSVDFTFHLSGWLNANHEDPYKTLPELSNWHLWQTNCFYSDKEASLCAKLETLDSRVQQQLNLFYLPGDHHFNGNYQALIKMILAHSSLSANTKTTIQSPSAP